MEEPTEGRRTQVCRGRSVGEAEIFREAVVQDPEGRVESLAPVPRMTPALAERRRAVTPSKLVEHLEQREESRQAFASSQPLDPTENGIGDLEREPKAGGRPPEHCGDVTDFGPVEEARSQEVRRELDDDRPLRSRIR
jgi:hypothetical protein